MSYTSHGHWIAGTPAGGTRPPQTARCGGPGVCTVCSREFARTTKSTICFNHIPKQKRDARPPWCVNCGLTAQLTIPYSRFEERKLSYLTALQEALVDPNITAPRKEGENPPDKARRLVVEHFNEGIHQSDDFKLQFEQTYVVSFTYILGNWKAMVSTDIPDNKYYEVTYDRDNRRAYVDEYVKVRNTVHADNPEPVQRPRAGGFSDEPSSRGGFTL